MRRKLLIVLPTLMAACALAWGQGGTDRYRLGGRDHDVPLRYEFSRTAGLPREADGSLWLILPAAEIAEGVPGYGRVFRGYAGPVAADLIIRVFDDPDAREFKRLQARTWSNLHARLAEGAAREPEPTAGSASDIQSARRNPRPRPQLLPPAVRRQRAATRPGSTQLPRFPRQGGPGAVPLQLHHARGRPDLRLPPGTGQCWRRPAHPGLHPGAPRRLAILMRKDGMRPPASPLAPQLGPASVPLTELRDGSAPPQPDEPHGSGAQGPVPSRLRRLRDFLLFLLWP